MKSFIILSLLLILSTTVMAVPQYNYGSIGNANNGNNKSDAFIVKGNGNSSYGLQNAMHFNTHAQIYVSFSKGQPTTFGAYTLDGKKISQSFSFAETADGRYTVVDANNKPVQFKPGDVVGFWVEDKDGNTVYNTPGVEGSDKESLVGTHIQNKNEYVIGFGSGNNGNMHNASSVMNVQITTGGSSGQPLPGVLIALLLGGGTLGAAGIFNLKNR